jgi:hypothetical protein
MIVRIRVFIHITYMLSSYLINIIIAGVRFYFITFHIDLIHMIRDVLHETSQTFVAFVGSWTFWMACEGF